MLAYLQEDLRHALAIGSHRDQVSANGRSWLRYWALIAGLMGIVLFAACGYQAGFLRINGAATQAPAWLWQWLTLLGDERVALAAALFFSRTRPRIFWSLLVSGGIALFYTHLLKQGIAAPRPPAVLRPDQFSLLGPALKKNSFPSGHTVTATLFFGVWIAFLKSVPQRCLLTCLALLAGLSRIALGVHWPVDVAAGLFGGASSAWLGLYWADRWAWGFRNPMVHLGLLLPCIAAAISLIFWDRGYTEAALPQQLLGILALIAAFYRYLFQPIRKRS